MTVSLPAVLARPLIELWLRTSPASWRRRMIAEDPPRVHTPGVDPDRVLITGDGVASGRGVLTHDLGLPGHLARGLSARTGNATDVDIVVDQDMTVRTCLDALAGIDLLRYDIIVLSIGHNETLALMSPTQWETDVRDLLTTLHRRVADATKVFILPVPVFGPRSPLPPVLARVVDNRAHELNTATFRLAATLPDVTLIWDTDAVMFQPETTHLYGIWADGIAEQISRELEQDRIPAGETNRGDEGERLRAAQEVEAVVAGGDPVLERLLESARHAFGTAIAAITLVHSDTLTMAATSGSAPFVLPRSESFCDATIRRSRHLVIEDATQDARFANYSVVTGAPAIRFYAGYPVESPDGHRVGAVCVLDTRPRRFTHHDLQLLRTVAHLVQDHLRQQAAL